MAALIQETTNYAEVTAALLEDTFSDLTSGFSASFNGDAAVDAAAAAADTPPQQPCPPANASRFSVRRPAPAPRGRLRRKSLNFSERKALADGGGGGGDGGGGWEVGVGGPADPWKPPPAGAQTPPIKSLSCSDLKDMGNFVLETDRLRPSGLGTEESGGVGLLHKKYRSAVNLETMADPKHRSEEAAWCRRNLLGPIQDDEQSDRPKRVLFCCHGSRGDVQPLVALALGLRDAGYQVAFWTVRPVNKFVESHGFRTFVHDLDMEDMMRRVQSRVDDVAGTMGQSLGFFHSMVQVFNEADIKPRIDEIPDEVLKAHLEFNPDLSITSHCMPAISCAEYLHIPVIYIALQPMYPTSQFPPFAFASRRFNLMSWLHKPLGHIFMSIYESQTYMKGVLRCRRLAGLPIRRFQDGTPVYNLRFVPTCTVISTTLVPQPDDWPNWQKVCGFLLMQNGTEEVFDPPTELLAFLEGGAKPLYVGFGSMCGDEDMAVRLTRLCMNALMRTNSRGVLLGGWAGMTRKRLDPVSDQELIRYAEQNVFEMKSCPHTWLFPRCAAVVHHGGAGTLAAGLSAGCPTVVCPFIFDQQYFGGLVEDRGCGVLTSPARSLEAAELVEALVKVTTDPEVTAAALGLSERLREENGVRVSIDFIEEVIASFPFPWTIKNRDFVRDEPRWADGAFAHAFDQSGLLDSLN